ncbi:MAG: methyltransferase domain-containing protein [Cephaloticoccus sp.]|nr:methyltransferase domain-containing protein [Cephaloticoccus sp.]
MRGSNQEFWEKRYLNKTTPWDYRGVPPAFTAFLQRNPSPGAVLIPGCGLGHEVKAFHAAGWQTLAIDYAPTAVAQAKDQLGPLASLVRQADFFGDDLDGAYDLIYERTFICALAPKLWPTCVDRLRQLLRPKGILAGFFVYGAEDEGPPNPFSDLDQARALFSGFELIADHPIPEAESQPMFANRERWQEWRLTESPADGSTGERPRECP